MKKSSPFNRSLWLAAAAGLMITIVFMLVWDSPIQKYEVLTNQMSRKRGVFIVVTDNGPGRNSGAQSHGSAGHGIKTMDEFYRLFIKYHGYKINTEFIDLSPERDGQSGLRVEVRIERG